VPTVIKTATSAAALVALLMTASGAGQAPTPVLHIVAPAAGSFVSGSVMIRATIEPPPQAVERVTFFVDGRQVGTVDAPPFQCEWNAGTQLREHVFRVVAALPGGQRLADSVRTKGTEYAEAVDVDMVHVTVTVLDAGRFVRGLTRDSFRVFEDNTQQPISHFASENIPLELVVGIDVSGSMTDSIDGVKEHVKRFLSALRPTDRVTLVAFNENFFVLSRPTADLAARLRALDRVAPWGMTALHETIIRSFDLLGTQPGRRGLVLFTDGEDTSSRVNREAVERRAESSDAVLFMIGQGRATDTPGLKALCEALAKRSGGRAFFPRDIESLRATFDEIIEELSSQYLVTYAPPSLARDGAWHQIRVEVADNRYTVRARQGYRRVTGQPGGAP
jgi:Ca-activated chloride channel family protein